MLSKFFQALLGAAALTLTALIAFGRLLWRKICNKWTKWSKWFRCMLLLILVLIPISIVGLIGYIRYDVRYGRSYWRDKSLSENIVAHGFRDDCYRVYDLQSEKYLTKKIRWVVNAAENDSLAVYAIPGKRGFINTKSGQVVIPAEDNDYRKAWVFSEGLAAVMKDGKIGFIDAKNEIVIPFVFDYPAEQQSCDFGYIFHYGYCIMTNKDGKFGLIDRTGKWRLEPVYDEVWTSQANGYRIVFSDDKYGVVDSLCNIVYPVEYSHIKILSNGFMLCKDGRKWQVDIEGNVVNPFMFDCTYYIEYPIGTDEDGVTRTCMSDYVKYDVHNFSGIMNRHTGVPITPAIYIGINMLSEGLFEVQDPVSNEWHLIDVNGNPIPGK